MTNYSDFKRGWLIAFLTNVGKELGYKDINIADFVDAQLARMGEPPVSSREAVELSQLYADSVERRNAAQTD